MMAGFLMALSFGLKNAFLSCAWFFYSWSHWRKKNNLIQAFSSIITLTFVSRGTWLNILYLVFPSFSLWVHIHAAPQQRKPTAACWRLPAPSRQFGSHFPHLDIFGACSLFFKTCNLKQKTVFFFSLFVSAHLRVNHHLHALHNMECIFFIRWKI